MKVLDKQQTALVAGGDLMVTQHISREGISDACVQVMISALQDQMTGVKTEEEVIVNVFSVCTMKEMELFGDRLEKAFIVSAHFE